jgi:hypothetical protein
MGKLSFALGELGADSTDGNGAETGMMIIVSVHPQQC